MEDVWEKIKAYIRYAVRCVDHVLIIIIKTIRILSIVTIFGAVDNFGMSKLKMQIAMFLVGSVATVVIATLDFRVIVNKLWLPFFIGSVILLGITLIWGKSGVSMETGNKSWLQIPLVGLMIQPSEFVKFAFICTFSRHLALVQSRIRSPRVLPWLAVHALLIL